MYWYKKVWIDCITSKTEIHYIVTVRISEEQNDFEHTFASLMTPIRKISNDPFRIGARTLMPNVHAGSQLDGKGPRSSK